MSSGSGNVNPVYEIMYNPNYIPQSSSTVHMETLTLEDKTGPVLIKESKAEFYEIDPITEAIWRRLDGRRTVKEIFDEVKAEQADLTEENVKEVLVSLAEEGLIKSTEEVVHQGRVEVLSATQLDLHLVKDASKTFAAFFRVTRKLIRKQMLPAGLAVAGVGFVLFFTSFLRIYANPSLLSVAGSPLLGFFVYELGVLLPVYAIHELAHASVCDYYGAKPREMGTGLYFFAPFFYCDTSDAWRVSRKARIMISAAGPLSTVVIASIFVFASFFTSGYTKDVLQIAAFFGFYGSLLNFSPILETDGYYILTDVLNIPNLRDESFGVFKRTFLSLIGRRVKAPRQSAKKRRVITIFAVATLGWLAFFGYTTVWLWGIYATSAYFAILSLGGMAVGLNVFNLTKVGVDIATLAYFSLIVGGFLVMGGVYYNKIRMKGIKLETIHEKRASVFLPLPSDVQSGKSSELVGESKKLARKFSRSSSVTLQPPFCVAELKMGKVDQSLEEMWKRMDQMESSFRSLHRSFLAGARGRRESSGGAKVRDSLVRLAESFPPSERGRALSAVSRHVREQEGKIGEVLQAAFGTVWTLELSPEDYRRIRKGLFPALIAGDLSITDLPSEVEDFKRRSVLGMGAMAQLSTEIETESKDVYKKPDVYQTTVFLEPVKSRLVFVGRTDTVQGATVWLGGLYLYQAWLGFIREALEEATLGLRSVRLAHPANLTENQASKLSDGELMALKDAIGRLEGLGAVVDEATGKIDSTFETAANFHEMLEGLVTDSRVDVGLYKPILAANKEHLTGVREGIKDFRKEFSWVSKRLTESKEAVEAAFGERSKSPPTSQKPGGSLSSAVSRLTGGGPKSVTPAYETETKLIFAATRMVYGVVIGSDVIL